MVAPGEGGNGEGTETSMHNPLKMHHFPEAGDASALILSEVGIGDICCETYEGMLHGFCDGLVGLASQTEELLQAIVGKPTADEDIVELISSQPIAIPSLAMWVKMEQQQQHQQQHLQLQTYQQASRQCERGAAEIVPSSQNSPTGNLQWHCTKCCAATIGDLMHCQCSITLQ